MEIVKYGDSHVKITGDLSIKARKQVLALERTETKPQTYFCNPSRMTKEWGGLNGKQYSSVLVKP